MGCGMLSLSFILCCLKSFQWRLKPLNFLSWETGKELNGKSCPFHSQGVFFKGSVRGDPIGGVPLCRSFVLVRFWYLYCVASVESTNIFLNPVRCPSVIVWAGQEVKR